MPLELRELVGAMLVDDDWRDHGAPPRGTLRARLDLMHAGLNGNSRRIPSTRRNSHTKR